VPVPPDPLELAPFSIGWFDFDEHAPAPNAQAVASEKMQGTTALRIVMISGNGCSGTNRRRRLSGQ